MQSTTEQPPGGATPGLITAAIIPPATQQQLGPTVPPPLPARLTKHSKSTAQIRSGCGGSGALPAGVCLQEILWNSSLDLSDASPLRWRVIKLDDLVVHMLVDVHYGCFVTTSAKQNSNPNQQRFSWNNTNPGKLMPSTCSARLGSQRRTVLAHTCATHQPAYL